MADTPTVPTAAPAATTTVTTTLASVATTAEKAISGFASVEGPLLTGISIFVPGAAAYTVPLQSILPLILPDIEKALQDIASGTYGDIWAVGAEFISHITAGKANSPALSPTPTGPVTAG
jgi:hypothetical protein